MQVVDPYLIAACSSADSNSTSKNNVILSKMTGTWRIIFEVVLAQRRMQQRAMLKLLTFFTVEHITRTQQLLTLLRVFRMRCSNTNVSRMEWIGAE
mmetsp:Transcript_27630/g.40769  ORF Transcript_27630/g.40769 Transcript_27630/m.40769 type:complete len:96 (-) Transcript_27630:478-765(-)